MDNYSNNNNIIDPPLQEICNTLLNGCPPPKSKTTLLEAGLELHELPRVDLERVDLNDPEMREECTKEIYEAACEFGLFQVINHGVPQEVLESMRREQMDVFRQPFKNKSEDKFLNLRANSYRWGNPKATALSQFSWSEALHVPLSVFSRMDDEYNNLRFTMEAFAKSASTLAQSIAEILVEKLGGTNTYYGSFFREKCTQNSCYLRMNRYPPCPFSSHVHGLIPHTDTSFLTVLHGDRVGGLQFYKDGRWISVKPNPQALIIHIGDLFQAMSNGVYRSIEHRVVAANEVERYSAAYFFCPTHDAIVESCNKPALYRKFTYSEYRQKIQEDVEATGHKVGLSRFLVRSNPSPQPRTLTSPGKTAKNSDVNECYSSCLQSNAYCKLTDAIAM